MQTELSLDYETYSTVDIKKEGGGKYVRHPETEILMLGWAFDDDEPSLWQPHLEPMPTELKEGMEDPHVLKWAFNAPFEIGITKYHLPEVVVPDWSWRCTMFLAYNMAFTGGLDAVLKQVGFPQDMWKSPEGHRLIRKFSMPQPRSRKVRRWYHDTAPEDWQLFCDYCRQDVRVERALRRWLMTFDPVPGDEWINWHMDQDINNRGVPVDTDLVKVAMALVDYRKSEIVDRMYTATGLANPTSNAQLLPWLQARGVPLRNMQAPHIDEVLPTIQDLTLRQVLQDKRWHSQTATSKWEAFDRMSCPDGTLKGMFVTGGASRTLREASRGINLQNLKRPVVDDMDKLCSDLKCLDLSEYPQELMDLLATSVRGGIAAPRGQILSVADLGSIESRVLGWVSDCHRINNIFAAGKDTYKDFATDLFSVPYEEVTSEQRKFSKPPTLGCGYQLGPPGLVEYASGMGVTMSIVEAARAVGVFRSGYPEIPKMWRWLADSCIHVTNTWQPAVGYKVRIHRDAEFLYIQLPSGHKLSYHKPEVVQVQIQWHDAHKGHQTAIVDNFSYMGINRFNLQWERITTHGGGLTENIVQAISRHILFYHLRIAMSRGIDVRAHVHDEIITVGDRLPELLDIMRITPPWAEGLLLDAAGYTSRHYRKD